MHHRLHILLLIVLFALCIPGIAPTHANSALTVMSTVDAVDAMPGDGKCETAAASPLCTLRAAIQEANARPGADVIILPSGTYTLTRVGTNEQAAAVGDLDILGDLTITGGGAASTTIDANGIDRVFEVMEQSIVHMTGVTIQGGNPGDTPGYTQGGGILNSGMLSIEASTIRSNTAQYGAGIYSQGASLVLSGTTIEQNTAHGDGGGISSNSAVTLTESTLRGNHAIGYGSSGGGFYNYGALVVRNSSVVSNTAEANGGGIANYMTLSVVDSRISENTAGGSGGGLHNPAAADTTLMASRVTNNSAGSQGGGIWNNGNLLQITESAITGNRAGGDGGGVWVAGLVRLERGIVTGNRAANGGAFANLTSLEVIDSTIADNQATSGGGGVTNMQGAWLRIAGSTLSGNAAASGGGVSNRGTTTAINSTFSDNTAAVDGGGILAERFSSPYGAIQLANVTLSGNVADADGDGSGNGGGVAIADGSITTRNSIVAGNTDRSGPAPDCWGTLTSQGYNLIGLPSGCTMSGETAGNLLGVDPQLSVLQDNGGPTFTHALRSGSPAIDAGTPAGCTDDAGNLLISDQRGAARPQDGDGNGAARCDIGAYEVGIAPRTPTPTPQPTVTPLPSACLAYGVADAGQAASQFFTLDPQLGAVQALGPLHPGADIEAIAIHPASGEVYAATGDDGQQPGYLYHLDRARGTLAPVGSTGFHSIDALAFRQSDASLWGWASDHGLSRIDLSTGAATLVVPALGDSSALAWSLDGQTLYGVSGTTLWSYTDVTAALTTINTNFPATSLMLAIQPDGQLLSGVEQDHALKLVLYDLTRQQVAASARFSEPYDDLEALAWPGACADTLLVGMPKLTVSAEGRAAPASYFPLEGDGFTSGTSVTVRVNDVVVGTLAADTQGQLRLALFFSARTPPGKYVIDLEPLPHATIATASLSWSPATELVVDAEAPQQLNHGTLPIINGTLTLYLPIILSTPRSNRA